MSMLDSFFSSKGFKAAKCKTLLKLTNPRIKLLRNRREIQLKQMRRDIAKLLENGQEATARIRVEHIIREENMMAAQEILELFSELITVRLPIIETQRECPLDLKEAISSICFAAPRCADLPELLQVQVLFAAKYGKEFVTAATELMPDCGVNRQIIELLSVRAPPVEAKLKLLKEIAEEHELDWDPSATETEFFKPHEDLLNGPNHFKYGSAMPLTREKHDTVSSGNVDESHIETDSDADFDSLDLPEVPKDSVRPVSDIPSAPGISAHVRSASANDLEPDQEVTESTPENENMPHAPPMRPDQEPSIASAYAHPNVAATGNRQFIPFINPPSFHSFSEPAEQSGSIPPVSSVPESMKLSEPAVSPLSSSITDLLEQHQSPPPPTVSSFTACLKSESNPTAFPSALGATAKQIESISSPFSSSTLSANQSQPPSSLPRSESNINVDLQDVLTAAQAAAETAERAAVAARAAASLAHVRITDLVMKRNNQISNSSRNEVHGEGSQQPNTSGRLTYDRNDSFSSNFENSFSYETKLKLDSLSPSSHEVREMDKESVELEQQNLEHPTIHVPQRLPSLEDDPYYSYPNLFTPKNSGSN